MTRRSLLLLDVFSVLAFVAIGRSVHADGVTLGGMASTSWPFLTGLAAGWTACAAWRRQSWLMPGGVAVWLVCVSGGMTLRVVSGQGTAVAFIGVALGFLGACMLGWRLLAMLVARVVLRQKVSSTVPHAAES